MGVIAHYASLLERGVLFKGFHITVSGVHYPTLPYSTLPGPAKTLTQPAAKRLRILFFLQNRRIRQAVGMLNPMPYKKQR